MFEGPTPRSSDPPPGPTSPGRAHARRWEARIRREKQPHKTSMNRRSPNGSVLGDRSPRNTVEIPAIGEQSYEPDLF